MVTNGWLSMISALDRPKQIQPHPHSKVCISTSVLTFWYENAQHDVSVHAYRYHCHGNRHLNAAP